MIQLKKVDSENIWKLVQLSVKEEQQDFVATNTESILEAYTTITADGVALPFGIYEDDTPIGFVMFGYGTVDGEDDPAIAAGNYCIWRFMIDRKYQGKGYGKAAFQAALDYVCTFPCQEAQYCWLSYEPENVVAKSLYASFGFKETGDYSGEEVVAVLNLADYQKG